VLDHPTQQLAVMPWLGLCYALHFTGLRFRAEYEKFLRGEAGASLSFLHAESSCLKAFITQRVNDGIEALRKLCGGHGYSQLSGLPELSANYLAIATLEGTQQVLEPQFAKYVLKLAADLESGRADPAKARAAALEAAPYLLDDPTQGPAEAAQALEASPEDPAAQLRCLGVRCRDLVRGCARSVAQRAARDFGGDARQALAQSGVALGRLARAHAEWVLLRDLLRGGEAVAGGPSAGGPGQPAVSPPVRAALADLASVLGLHLLTSGEGPGQLLRVGALTPAALGRCELALEIVCHRLRSEAAALVDAWDLSPAQLGHSAIGAGDGKALEYADRLLEYAGREPLNSPDFKAHLPAIFKLTHRAKM